jgi:hypothetical protein
MSFLTEATPLTERATRIAVPISWLELTKPLS